MSKPGDELSERFWHLTLVEESDFAAWMMMMMVVRDRERESEESIYIQKKSGGEPH